MDSSASFLDMSAAKQHVNTALCIAFAAVCCYWLALYYFTEKAMIIGDNFTAANAAVFK